MTDRLGTDALADTWQKAMDQRRYKDAVKAGCEAWLRHESEGDENGSMAALSLIHLAIAELIFRGPNGPAKPSPACSFCGQSGSEVRLGAGPDVFICADCVAIFHDALAAE